MSYTNNIRLLLQQLSKNQHNTLEDWDKELSFSFEEKEFIEHLKDRNVIKLNNQQQFHLKDEHYFTGILSVSSKDFGFVDVEGLDDGFYVNHRNFNGALDNDEVFIRVYKGSDGRLEGEILEVITRSMTKVVGTLYQDKEQLVFKPYDNALPSPMAYENPKNLNLQSGQRVIGEIKSFNPISLELVEVLGLETEPGMDVLTILHSHNISMGFDAAELRQARSFKKTIDPEDFPSRRDLTDEIIFTIDGEDTKDIDDAISIKRVDKGYQLGVHIADVSHYVNKNSYLDQGARSKGTSVYVVDRVVPMLPVELSNGLCSLNPHVNRLAMSVYINYDEYGTITDYEFFESVINSKQKCDYREVNRFFDNPNDVVYLEQPIKDSLIIMEELSDRLRMMREANGAIEFETSESEFIVDASGKVLDIKEKLRGRSEMMIEDFMVAANQCAADIFDNADLPTLYRVHEKPSLAKMQELSQTLRIMNYKFKGKLDNIYPADIQRVLYHFRNEPTFHVVSMLVLRSMARAKYWPENLGHFGLGLKNYAHFTSPIRRYPDLIVHRNLKKYFISPNFDEQSVREDMSLMSQLATETSQLERQADEAEREVEKMKKAQYMKQYVGKKFKGVVSGVTKFGVFVELANTVEGLAHIKTLNDYYVFDEYKMTLTGQSNKNTYKLGQQVKVKVKSVNETEGEIDFIILEDNAKSSNKDKAPKKSKKIQKKINKKNKKKNKRK